MRWPICTPWTSTANGLMHLGKPAGFVGRQVRGWSDRWQRSKTSELAEMDALAAWLVEQLPPDPAQPGDRARRFQTRQPDARRRPAGADRRRLRLGDERARRSARRSRHPARLLGAVGAARPAGRVDDRHEPSRVVHARRTGGPLRRAQRTRSRRGCAYYEVFALFKIAVVIQQIYYRFVKGQTDDPRFAAFGDRVTHLARQAARLAG